MRLDFCSHDSQADLFTAMADWVRDQKDVIVEAVSLENQENEDQDGMIYSAILCAVDLSEVR